MTQSMAFVLCQQQEQKGSKRSISRRRMVTRRGWWLTGGPKVPPTSAPPPPHWSISGRTSDSRRDMHSILCKEIKNLYKLHNEWAATKQEQSRISTSTSTSASASSSSSTRGQVCPSVLAGQQLPKIVAVRLARSLTMATTANGT